MQSESSARVVSRSVPLLGPIVLFIAVALYVAAYLHWHSLSSQVDLFVYRFGAERVWDGQDLYSLGSTGNTRTMLFVYTPFSALAFLPLIELGQTSVVILGLVVNVLCVGYVVRRSLGAAGVSSSAGLWALTALLVAPVIWLAPIQLSLQLGQVNLVIMALVAADVLSPATRKWAGIGIGIAAGIKLTPAIFVIFLIAIGRRRAAAIATATFAATIAIGFLLLPTDSREYWLQGRFRDVHRISSDPLANTSLQGLLLRLHWLSGWQTALVVAFAIVALAVATVAWRSGRVLLSLAIVGMTSVAASPFSWSHHWVWFAPLLVHLGLRAYLHRSRISMVAFWMLAVILGGWLVPGSGDPPNAGLLYFRHPGLWDQLLPATYLFVLVLVLICTTYTLWRERTHEAAATVDEVAHEDARAKVGADAF